MQDTVTNSPDISQVADDSILIIKKHPDDQLNCLFMSRGRELCIVLLFAICLMLNGGIFQSDAFYNTNSKNIFVDPVVHLVLGRRTTTVQG